MPQPTPALTLEPTDSPTAEPPAAPTAEPTVAPSVEPTPEPTAAPTVAPTAAPTEEPSSEGICCYGGCDSCNMATHFCQSQNVCERSQDQGGCDSSARGGAKA